MKKEETRLEVRVQPNARNNQVQGFREGILHLKIAAPAVEGKANRELIRYLSDILGIAKSRISVEKGATGRRKLVNIIGFDREEIAGVLAGLNETGD